MTDLDVRATRIFGSYAGGGVDWPSGLEAPPWSRRLRRPATDEPQWSVIEAQQSTIVEWAEHYRLEESSKRCCARWLGRETSRSCPSAALRQLCVSELEWADHPIFWLKNGLPAVITTAPYDLGAQGRALVDRWLAQDAMLRVDYGQGWYGHGTTQVVMWRVDRIDFVVPAVMAKLLG